MWLLEREKPTLGLDTLGGKRDGIWGIILSPQRRGGELEGYEDLDDVMVV